jgi:hypothetical protein
MTPAAPAARGACELSWGAVLCRPASLIAHCLCIAAAPAPVPEPAEDEEQPQHAPEPEPEPEREDEPMPQAKDKEAGKRLSEGPAIGEG